MSCDFYDEAIKRMADFAEKSFARQEAMHAEFMSETRDFHARIDKKLNRIMETINDIKKTSFDMKHDMARLKIIMTIIIVSVQIISALLVHFLK